MEDFNDLQSDVLTEAFNLGMGLAGSSLSQMVGEEITLSVPTLLHLKHEEAAARLAKENVVTVTGVTQHFDGPFSGNAMLLFPAEKCLSLVQLLLKDTVPADEMTELQEEALCEIGNIILNAGLSSIANMFDHEVHSDLPNFVQGESLDVLNINNDDTHVFFMQVDFSISSQDIHGYVIYLLDTESIHDLEKSIDKYLKRNGLS